MAESTESIILASNSPRRAMLLREAGIEFEAIAPTLEEPTPQGWKREPAEFAASASYFKARSVAEQHPDRVILAADTVVSLDDVIYGKPRDRADARRILGELCGTTQDVITGVTLLHAAAGRRQIAHDVTHVTMRKMSDAELEAYLDSGDWEGKAGAYGIQDTGDRFITRVDGSFSNVVGLPIELVLQMLSTFGLQSRP